MTTVRIDVTLPDDLAEALARSGLPASSLCERALEQALRRVTALRSGDVELPNWTARARTALRLATQRTDSAVTTADVLHGVLTEGTNLAVRLLPPLGDAPLGPEDAVPQWSGPALAALELAHAEAAGLGHNYVGCEHLLLGLLAEPSGRAGEFLRARGLDLASFRAAVVAALAGFTHARG
ncbi:Clp protease N-terminal domain-containing protein [Dactylosporangium sp. CA-052675]|uniref:Clp protease N-terminal domain-containing protein n=1 Tax=Dactylosporangium sp. CA-052675 TaxID=3239927 RepID=UPI003D93DF18